MRKTTYRLRSLALRFKHFSRKSYSLFSCLGREVIICTLSVATLTHAKANGISIVNAAADDSLNRQELRLDEVVVTGARAPLTQGEAAKLVTVLTREDINGFAAETVNDVLKHATSVDVRQRGGFGVQTDISIGGGTFDQIAILLNGVNISNPQTGHLSADFPVSLDDIQRIEIIQGAAARVYGAGAFNGAINIVTTPETNLGGSATIEGGSYGTFGAAARMAFPVHQSISAGYKQSDGGTANSYFRKANAFYQGALPLSKLHGQGRLDWSLGLSTMRYGANTFYSAAYPNQYESNARIFANVRGNIPVALGKTLVTINPSIYWNRNYDHFQLIRHSTTGENFHRNDVLGASLNAYTEWALGKTSIGAELRKEKIYSTNLGTPMSEDEWFKVPHYDVNYTKSKGRTDLSLFLEHNILLKRFTASLGVMANRNTGYNNRFRLYPGIDMSYRPSKPWKITLSWNMAFRMPTFTDLFYKSPTQEGNIGLKPEKTNSLRLGVLHRTRGVQAQVSVFYDFGTDMIDWVMYSAEDKYHSANFRLDNRGFDINADLMPREWNPSYYINKVHVGYAYINQARYDDITIYKSNYAMEYLRHKVTASVDHRIFSALSASWAFRWQERMGSYIIYENNKSTGVAKPYSPYALFDLKLMWQKPRYEIALSLNNLTNRRYYDLGNVEQPGFWLMASAKVKW
ncbi:MAG: TonB-dependent receptor [Prevotella sp.]|nr:TonB-dependent receptor [Prevotella sp.]